MKVNFYPNKISKKRTTLILGSFEYIHNGHYELIKAAKKLKKPISMMIIDNPSLLPFSNHKNISFLSNRLQILANLGVDYVEVIKVSSELLNTPGEDFIEKIVYATNADFLVMGKDFAVGKGAKYKAKDISKKYNSIIVDFVKVNQKKLSSTLLSEFLQLGEVDLFKKNCPSPYQINLSFDGSKKAKNYSELQPLHSGIYATKTIVNNVVYWSLTHINQNHDLFLYVPDLKIKNKPFDATIEFHMLIRIIISSTKDEISEIDKAETASYLLAL